MYELVAGQMTKGPVNHTKEFQPHCPTRKWKAVVGKLLHLEGKDEPPKAGRSVRRALLYSRPKMMRVCINKDMAGRV